ncbi:hypothetical protein QNO07_25655 [Streptomyces sp. 549]|uniref:hypothetical protein n=1 Tax=Streptomyces sp. 549 TaxID=3049076 RepID=UPI0024C459AA|nr:hypothetical protein [Streptomyces sp. 549]MDK1476746.1 hypothetical protein [Streptomyces sp. 549]
MMFAALYGTLAPHSWHSADSEPDAYSLFHDGSIAMGWLDDTSAGGGSEDRMTRAPGLWGMNDAGWDHPLETAGTGLIAWFQVEASAVADDRPLPVRPFLRCAEAATARAGTQDLSAVQLLLPVQGLDPASRPPYAPVPAMLTKEWFAQSAPHARTRVQVHISSGQNPAFPGLSQQLADHIAHLDQDVFTYEIHEVADHDAVIPPPIDDGAWDGPPRHSVTMRGELAEWTVDAIGWLSEVIADCYASLGLRTPLLLTVTHTRRP